MGIKDIKEEILNSIVGVVLVLLGVHFMMWLLWGAPAGVFWKTYFYCLFVGVAGAAALGVITLIIHGIGLLIDLLTDDSQTSDNHRVYAGHHVWHYDCKLAEENLGHSSIEHYKDEVAKGMNLTPHEQRRAVRLAKKYYNHPITFKGPIIPYNAKVVAATQELLTKTANNPFGHRPPCEFSCCGDHVKYRAESASVQMEKYPNKVDSLLRGIQAKFKEKQR